MAKQNKLSKANLMAEIQAALGADAPSRAWIEQMLDTVADVAHKHLKAGFTVELPGLVRLKVADKAAAPERQRKNPFTGQMMTVAAKPASKKIKVAASKSLKAAINGA